MDAATGQTILMVGGVVWAVVLLVVLAALLFKGSDGRSLGAHHAMGCPRCGAFMGRGDRYCHACGTRVA